MKTDLYTKIVLTVIAVVLTINLLKDFDLITTARAGNPSAIIPANEVVAPKEVIDVNIVKVDGYSVSSSIVDPIKVKVVD